MAATKVVKALLKVEMKVVKRADQMVARTVHSVDKMVATTALLRVGLLVGHWVVVTAAL